MNSWSKRHSYPASDLLSGITFSGIISYGYELRYHDIPASYNAVAYGIIRTLLPWALGTVRAYFLSREIMLVCEAQLEHEQNAIRRKEKKACSGQTETRGGWSISTRS